MTWAWHVMEDEEKLLRTAVELGKRMTSAWCMEFDKCQCNPRSSAGKGG